MLQPLSIHESSRSFEVFCQWWDNGSAQTIILCTVPKENLCASWL
jgi:hypothetical protein